MKPSALDYLVCNACYGRLSLEIEESIVLSEGKEPEILSGVLKCLSCKKQFPVRSGVPRFVDEKRSSQQNLETGQRFGIAWKEFPRLAASYRDQFYDWMYPVDAAFVKDKIVLEAGCGKGRHAQLIAEAGAAQIFAIDIGEAVDVTYANVGHMERVHVVQSDICQLPFTQVFDFAFSLGVLHHMDVPAAGFSSIVNCLTSQGAVCVWVYGRENNWWLIHLINPVRTLITARLPAPPLKLLAFLLAVPVWAGARFVARPYMETKKKLGWLPDLFYGHYLSYIGRFDFNEIHHIVFDHLVAPVSNYIPGEEVAGWFAQAKLTTPIIRWHNKNSWTGFASRKAPDTELMLSRVARAVPSGNQRQI